MAHSGNARILQFNNPHGSLIMTRLHDQRVTGTFCDVILHVGSQTYAAHKNLLAASSLYFESMFLAKSSLEKEADAVNDKSSIHVTIDTVSVCPTSFRAVLDYLYLGSISIEVTSVSDVLLLAEEFYLDSLRDYCNAYLGSLRESNTVSCPRVSIKRQDDDHRESSEETDIEDYFRDSVSSPTEELKVEIKIENEDTECDSPSPSRNDRLPLISTSKRKHYSRNKGLTKRKPNIHEVAREVYKVLGNCELTAIVNEPTTNNYRNGKLNIPESQAVKGGRKFPRKSAAREELIRNNFPRKTITHHQLRAKLKSSSNDDVMSSESCQMLENKLDESHKPDLKVTMGEKDIDTSQDLPSLKSIKKEQQAELNDDKRERVKSRKKSGSDRKIYAKGGFKTRMSCFWCSYKCQWKRELGEHVMTSHFPEPPYKCDQCEETLEEVQQLLQHKRIHSQWEKPFECTVCHKLFQFKYALNSHMRLHTGEKAFICPVCGRSFSMKANLNEHILTHGDYRPFLCHLCPYSTKHHSLLIAHQRTHTGELFHCEAPNCTYTNTRRSGITSHMRCHLEVRPHVCSTCAKSFKKKPHLVRHEQLHLDVRPFFCNSCGETFSRKDYLKTHRKRCCPELDGIMNNE